MTWAMDLAVDAALDDYDPAFTRAEADTRQACERCGELSDDLYGCTDTGDPSVGYGEESIEICLECLEALTQ
jgi:hypothetical protein